MTAVAWNLSRACWTRSRSRAAPRRSPSMSLWNREQRRFQPSRRTDQNPPARCEPSAQARQDWNRPRPLAVDYFALLGIRIDEGSVEDGPISLALDPTAQLSQLQEHQEARLRSRL